MGSSFDGAELPGLKIQIISCPSLILSVTAIQKGTSLPAPEHLFGHNGLTPRNLAQVFACEGAAGIPGVGVIVIKGLTPLSKAGMTIFLLQTATEDR